MKKIIISTICFLSIGIMFGQNNKSGNSDTIKKKETMYFGINTGFTTGLGFSYIYWPKKYGIQLTFLPLFDRGKQRFSSALTFLMFLTKYQSVNFFK
jgi:hypothetical protein